MKNKIIFLIILLFTSGCVLCGIDGYFISDSYKNNISPAKNAYHYKMKIRSFIDGKNLYFSTIAGTYGREMVIMIIPVHIDGNRDIMKLEHNNGEFSIYLNNINGYNRDIVKYLTFKIIDNGKEYNSEIKIRKGDENLYEKWLKGGKVPYGENFLIKYVFPVKINQLSKEFKLIVKYKDNEKVLNLKYKNKLYMNPNFRF